MGDIVEFYVGKDASLICSVKTSIVPPVGSLMNIRTKVWLVTGVSYVIDNIDDPTRRRIVAAVTLEKLGNEV